MGDGPIKLPLQIRQRALRDHFLDPPSPGHHWSISITKVRRGFSIEAADEIRVAGRPTGRVSVGDALRQSSDAHLPADEFIPERFAGMQDGPAR